MKTHCVARWTRALLFGILPAAMIAVIASSSHAQESCATDMSQIPALPASDCDSDHTNPAPYIPDPTSPLMRIPVVFHVITNAAQTEGNIDFQTILDQMEVLNEDFRAIPGTPGQNGIDTRIEFYLATEDPSGNPTDGVTYHADDAWFDKPFLDYLLMQAMLTELNWDPERYYNVYTLRHSDGGCTGERLPGLPGGLRDVVLLDWRGVGGSTPACPGHQRLMTHETGHYLGLRHPWGQVEDCGPECCSIDYCPDTNPPDCYSCFAGDLLCDTKPVNSFSNHSCSYTPCGGGPPVPTDSYMTYAFSCMNKFTPEQAARMRCNALTYRAELYEFATITVSGVVTYEGARIGGIEVAAIDEGETVPSATDVTDAIGRYAIELLDGWRGTVEVSKTLYYNDAYPVEYTFPPDPYNHRDFTVAHVPTTWNPDGLPVNILTETAHNGDQLVIAGDNMFVVWEDDRTTGTEVWDLYMQSFAYDGDIRWPNDVQLASEPGIRQRAQMISDGGTGTIVAWEDHRYGSPTIYVQRFDADGTPMWTANGVHVGTGEEPYLVPDGSGGAVMVWYAGSLAPGYIFAHHIQAGGWLDPTWPPSGTVIRADGDLLFNLTITTDDAGGAIATWQEWQSPSDIVIWAQRVDSQGVPQWPSPGSSVGIQVKPDPGSRPQELPAIAPDGAGGAFIAYWQQITPLPNDEYHVMAQRLDAGGSAPPPWDSTDLVIDDRPGNIYFRPELDSDGQGGFIATWEYNNELWAQRYDGDGSALWGDHIRLSPFGESIGFFNLAADGIGGANIVYNMAPANPGLWIQKLTSSGSKPLGANGIQVGDNAEAIGQPKIASDAGGRPVVVWVGERTSDDGVYIHEVDAPSLPPVVASNVIAYNDSIEGADEFFRYQYRLHMSWDTDASAFTKARYRKTGEADWSETPETEVASTAHWFEITGLEPGEEYELQPMSRRSGETAHHLGSVVTATTEAVGTSVSNFDISFQYQYSIAKVKATFTYNTADDTECRINVREDSDPPIEWGTSEVVVPSVHAGPHSHSVPGLRLNTNYNAFIILHNDGEDTMVPDGAVADETQTIEYIVFKTPKKPGDDIPIPKIMPGSVAQQKPLKNYLRQNHPNPFNPTTTVEYGVQEPGGRVQLYVYDVRGARVRQLVDDTQPAGIYEVVWNGRNDRGERVATGIYFFKLETGSDVFIKKAVLLK